jgi:hypothetical protein
MKNKTRVLLIIVAAIVVPLLSFCTSKQTNIPTTSKPVLESSGEEYNVYSVLINTRYLDERIKLIVIEENTTKSTAEVSDELIKQNMPELQQETVDDFKTANEQSYLLQREFNLPVNYVLISQEELNGIFGGGRGWDNFYNKYSDSQGIMTFSRVGFNAERSQALVCVGNQYHFLAGAGYIVLLVKEDGIWRVKHEVMSWIS